MVVITNKPTALRCNRQSSIYIGRGSGTSNGVVSLAQKYGPVKLRMLVTTTVMVAQRTQRQLNVACTATILRVETVHRPIPRAQLMYGKKRVKVAYSRLPSVGFRRWSWFLAVSLLVTWVINPTAITFRRACCQFAACWGTMGVPKTVTWQRRDCDLNPAPESSTLTTRLPSHPKTVTGYIFYRTSKILQTKTWKINLSMLRFGCVFLEISERAERQTHVDSRGTRLKTDLPFVTVEHSWCLTVVLSKLQNLVRCVNHWNSIWGSCQPLGPRWETSQRSTRLLIAVFKGTGSQP